MEAALRSQLEEGIAKGLQAIGESGVTDRGEPKPDFWASIFCGVNSSKTTCLLFGVSRKVFEANMFFGFPFFFLIPGFPFLGFEPTNYGALPSLRALHIYIQHGFWFPFDLPLKPNIFKHPFVQSESTGSDLKVFLFWKSLLSLNSRHRSDDFPTGCLCCIGKRSGLPQEVPLNICHARTGKK